MTTRFRSRESMTVKELIEVLQLIPSDAPVYIEGGEYRGDLRIVTTVEYQRDGNFERPNHAVLIK